MRYHFKNTKAREIESNLFDPASCFNFRISLLNEGVLNAFFNSFVIIMEVKFFCFQILFQNWKNNF